MTDFRLGSRMCDYCQRNLPSGDLCGCDGEKEARFRWMDKLIANGLSADLPSESSREDRLAAILAAAIEDHDSSVGCSMREAHWTNQARALLAATPAPPVDETDKLETHIWQRADEWVLEISGSINGTHFISRHTEPLTTPKENVAGLPSLYAALADRTQEGEVRRG